VRPAKEGKRTCPSFIAPVCGITVPVWATAAVLTFLGVTAVAGGLAMVSGAGGAAPPREWLNGIPFIDGWLLPGLVLGLGFGIGSLLTAYGLLRQPTWRALRPVEAATGHRWPWLATVLLGLAQIVWISLEVGYLPELSILQAVYGVVGFALLLLPLTPSVRRYAEL